MCQAIKAAYKAMALESYARQARNVEAEERARQIRMRAERKCGELLRDTPKAKPSGSNQHRPRDAGGPPKLADMGITKDQSSQWHGQGKPE